MLNNKALEQYRRVLEEAVAGSGRDDIGVGAVTEPRSGVIAVEFSRGTHMHTAEIPADSLQDHEGARRAVTSAIRALSKEVAQENLQKAM
ncbi:MAG TPA: hypothetical protein VFL28_07290 [bacterium]|nr:hypothetical protein [bacterium]